LIFSRLQQNHIALASEELFVLHKRDLIPKPVIKQTHCVKAARARL